MSPMYSPIEDFDLCGCFWPVFVLGVCVSLNYVKWFSCCCEIEIFFVQLCEMFKGINSEQTSGFWVFLCPPPCPSTGSRWGMLQGDTELGDSGMNRSSTLKCNSHLGSSVACAIHHYQLLLFMLFLYCGGFFLNFAVMLWFARGAGHTLHRQHDLLSTSLLGILLPWQSWLWIDVLSEFGFTEFGVFRRLFCMACCRPEVFVMFCEQGSHTHGRTGTSNVTGKGLDRLWFLCLV